MQHLKLICVVLVSGCILVDAHSYLTVPSQRKGYHGGCRYDQPGYYGDTERCAGPCDLPKGRATARTGVKRGDIIPVEWPRNNHHAGFVRLAWAPLAESDNPAAFHSRVQKIVCHETGGCRADGFPNHLGGDSDGTGGGSNPCKTYLQIPDWLEDGEWTLQWSWYGGYGALGDYYSCHDFRIGGGRDFKSDMPNPVFNGGDAANPNLRVCNFMNTQMLGTCREEPCQAFGGRQYPRTIDRPGGPHKDVPKKDAFGSNTGRDLEIGEPDASLGASGRLVAKMATAVSGCCGSTTTTTTPGTVTPVTPTNPSGPGPRSDSRCGKDFDNAPCKATECCSKYGWCGTTAAHCTDGPPEVKPVEPRADRRCGTRFGDAPCKTGECCSQYEWCGTSAQHCNKPDVASLAFEVTGLKNTSDVDQADPDLTGGSGSTSGAPSHTPLLAAVPLAAAVCSFFS